VVEVIPVGNEVAVSVVGPDRVGVEIIHFVTVQSTVTVTVKAGAVGAFGQFIGIEQVVTFSSANHRALKASLDVHVDVAVGDFEPVFPNAGEKTLVRLHGRASHGFRLTDPNNPRTPETMDARVIGLD
jgi:hypothetical protein